MQNTENFSGVHISDVHVPRVCTLQNSFAKNFLIHCAFFSAEVSVADLFYKVTKPLIKNDFKLSGTLV